MEYKRLRPSQTLLDPQNARLPDGTSNDREAINRLLAEGYTQLLALARDLCNRGEANPTELPIAWKDGSKYVVFEGNRRFAALKLVADPMLADDPAHRTAFKRLRDSGKKPPTTIFCAITNSREEADPWLTLRHTGANDGVGVRTWSAQQTAVHRQRMKAPVDSGTTRSIAIADELTEAYQEDTELVALINAVRASKLTNIGRLFAGVTLTRMQFGMKQASDGDSQTLTARHTANQLHDYFVWAFNFLNDNSVDAFKNDALRGDLLNNEAATFLPSAADSLPDHVRLADHPFSSEVDDTDNKDQGRDSADEDSKEDVVTGGDDTGGGGGDDQHDEGTSGSSGGTKRDKKPERFLYSGVKLPNLSPNIQRLLREAKALPIDDNYATACVQARVILELAVSDPKVLAWSGKNESDKLAQKIRGCIYRLDPDIDRPQKTRQDLVQAFMEVNEIGVVYMHQFMHNPMARADPHLARRFSGAFTPLLNSINEAVE
ncbi:hypothetical protein [Serinicoccus marinus]|uniref:hypothetical protein n=1 Tax=Serinicoccus marinus TaxID=247333 RepID=UPI0024932A16|nr:hypothetical protein [Serinicoccus marinus]